MTIAIETVIELAREYIPVAHRVAFLGALLATVDWVDPDERWTLAEPVEFCEEVDHARAD